MRLPKSKGSTSLLAPAIPNRWETLAEMPTDVTVSLVKLLKITLQYFTENINGEQPLCSKTMVRKSVLHMTNGVQKPYTVYKIQTETRVSRQLGLWVYLLEATDSYAVIFYQDPGHRVVLRRHLYCLPIVEYLRVVLNTSAISGMNQNTNIHCIYIYILYVDRGCRARKRLPYLGALFIY